MNTTGLLRTVLALTLALCPLLAAPPAAARSASSRPAASPIVHAATIGEVLSRWRPDAYLYVLGDVGLEDDALQDLSAWLADKHWTVLLVQDAAGQTWRDPDGLMRQDEDAIEYGTGMGIPRRPGFAAQIHPRTKEPDGAILSIVLAQRGLYYTGSQAQDSRSLGEDQFKGNLDQWAIAALRSGQDVGGAVRETVTQIDLRLDGAIEAEIGEVERSLVQATEQVALLESRSRALEQACPGGFRRLKIPDLPGLRSRLQAAQAAAAQGRTGQAGPLLAPLLTQVTAALQELDALEGAVDRARRALQVTAETLASLEQKAAALQVSHPELTGPLARPDMETFRQRLTTARGLLSVDPEEASKGAEVVRQEVAARLRAIDEYPAQGQALAMAETRLAGLERRPLATAAREPLLAARQTLREARELYASGTFGYGKKLDAGRSALDTAERRISAAEGAEALRRALLRWSLILLAIGLSALGILLNRRRRGARNEAERLLAGWRTTLDRKLEVVYDELEQRAARFVGPASGEGKRPHAGETLRLADEIRADLGSLSILWMSANRVLQKAEALIRARGLDALYNFFFAGHYRQSIALLHDEPVPFDPADGLPRLFGSERTWRQELLGDLASFAPFHKSFEEIVGELNLRAGRAAGSLDVIEQAIVHGPEELAGTEEGIGRTTALHAEIERAGSDGLFRVPAIFAAALPAAEAARLRSRELFPTDPVTALRGDGARARRIAVEAAQLVRLALDARTGALAAVERCREVLQETSIATGWIEAERRELSEVADRLAQRAAEEPVAAEAEELAQRLAICGGRSERAVTLCGVLQGTARPEIVRRTALVQTARDELGNALGLPPEQILREEGADPSAFLDGATGQADAAHAALGRGDLDAAEAALAEAARLAGEAVAIVEASRQACSGYASTDAERGAETARIEGLVPQHETILAGIRASFAPSVLLLRAGDPDHPNANGTLADNLDEVRLHVERRRAPAAGAAVAAAPDREDRVGAEEAARARAARVGAARARVPANRVGRGAVSGPARPPSPGRRRHRAVHAKLASGRKGEQCDRAPPTGLCRGREASRE